VIKVPEDMVISLKAEHDYVKLITKERNILIRNTMQNIEKQILLNKSPFIRIHRSHIVNIRKIVEISPGYVIIADQRVPIGISYREKIERLKTTLGKK